MLAVKAVAQGASLWRILVRVRVGEVEQGELVVGVDLLFVEHITILKLHRCLAEIFFVIICSGGLHYFFRIWL